VPVPNELIKCFQDDENTNIKTINEKE